MYVVKADKSRNRLTIVLKGTFNKTEGERCLQETIAAVNRLKRGFDIINDISEFTGSDKKSEEFFQCSCKLMKIRGANHIIRVVGASKEALVKFATVTVHIDNYPVKYVPSMEDAEKFLESQE